MNRVLRLATILALSGAALPALAQQAPDPAVVPGQAFLAQWDLDGDGQVTLAEARSHRADIFTMFDSDGDGVREKDGMKLKVLYQTSVNPVRQDFQAIIKSFWNEIGVEVELKQVDASVFFGGDAASPDTFQKFYADVEMYANNFEGNNPEPYLARQTCDKIPGPENQWQGENTSRFCDPEFDRMIGEMTQIVDPAQRGAIAHVRDADDQRGKHQGADQHLDQAQEDIREDRDITRDLLGGFLVGGPVKDQPADKNTQKHRNQDENGR